MKERAHPPTHQDLWSKKSPKNKTMFSTVSLRKKPKDRNRLKRQRSSGITSWDHSHSQIIICHLWNKCWSTLLDWIWYKKKTKTHRYQRVLIQDQTTNYKASANLLVSLIIGASNLDQYQTYIMNKIHQERHQSPITASSNRKSQGYKKFKKVMIKN